MVDVVARTKENRLSQEISRTEGGFLSSTPVPAIYLYLVT